MNRHLDRWTFCANVVRQLPPREKKAAAIVAVLSLLAWAIHAARGVQPSDIKWLVAGTTTQPAGAPVPLTDDLRARVAAALTPPPATRPGYVPPPAPALSYLKTDPTLPNRHEGIIKTQPGDYSYSNLHVSGFSTNLSFLGSTNVTLSNVRSVTAYHRDSNDQFGGQGLLIQGITGKATVTGYFARQNGWWPGCPPVYLGQYTHGVYYNFPAAGAQPYEFSDLLLAHCTNSGVESRGPGKITNAVILDAATAIDCVMGGLELDHVTIYDGHYHNEVTGGQVTAWTALSALTTCYPVKMNDVWIVGRVGQGARPPVASTARMFPQGAIVETKTWGGASTHDQWKANPAGPSVTATNCVIAGWPGATISGATMPAGFKVLPTPVEYDYEPVIADFELNKISKEDAIAKLHKDIRGRVKVN